jgi:hypothetical protein
MKDKLMELLLADVVCSTGDTGECDSCEYCYNEDACYKRMSLCIADNMIAKNVVVLPVKPRDIVYTISRGKIKEWIIYYVGMNTLGHFMFNFHDKDLQNSRSACDEDIGETVFLTEEDAINELKERKAYDNT